MVRRGEQGNGGRGEGIYAGLGFSPICTRNLSLFSSSLPVLSASRALSMASTSVTNQRFGTSVTKKKIETNRLRVNRSVFRRVSLPEIFASP